MVDTKNALIKQLNQIKDSTTDTEWLVFVLAYYEDLSLKEIALTLDRDVEFIDTVLDSVLRIALQILGPNAKLLTATRSA